MDILRGFTILLGLQMAGEVLAQLLELPVPGPVVGMLLLLTGLWLVPPLQRWTVAACNTLLAHLSLLFIPAGVGVVVHLNRLDDVFVGVGVTLAFSTVAGLVVTALTLQRLMRGRKTRESVPTGNP